ncbi:MAG TPA: aminotransferase class I/II-fold pyridoxal phosphate-dependent enzyme [Acidobacteriota bacterium]|nr:aminotransferase class I/II-fold pyridoxal phosphate-dependent enzyme [Acidobacteriota bacterium]
MRIEPFAMERMQSTWENLVDFNLSESGVHPMTLEELFAGESAQSTDLLRQELGYGQSNGTIELRDQIAALYPGATRDHILVTNGTSEANFVTVWNLVEPEDEIVMMLPNYMQTYGIARGFSGLIRAFHLREESGWAPDLDQLKKAITSKTKLIIVTNPNNPTGVILKQDEMREIVRAAQTAGAWLLCDEVYQGAERAQDQTRSFWGMYDRVICTNGLSKAYGLPGVRIGWIVAPPALIATLWSHHDYTTIGPSILSDRIARYALTPQKRKMIFARTRGILQSNYPVLKDWIAAHGKHFSYVEPQAGAIAYLRYDHPINSSVLVDKLLHEKSVLIVPGDHFGMDHYLRIGFGPPAGYLRAGLNRINECLSEIDD